MSAAPEAAEAAPGTTAAPPSPRGRRRSYEGASRSRQSDWVTTTRSADTEIFGKARTLRDKMRWLVRNNPHAAKAVAALASNIVGDGIVPRPVTGSPSRDKKIWDAFHRWAFKCDFGGQLDFYGMQTLIVREMLEGGEVLVRKRLRKRKNRGDVPLELQVLEADFLDPMRNGLLQKGGLTIQGVEIDEETNKRRAYWLYPFHPGSLFFATARAPYVSMPVPADEVLHVYEMQRTQTRGVPWGTPVIESLGLLADYELAEVVRKKIEACNVAVVTGAEDVTDDAVGISVTDSDGNEVEKFEPGMILRLHGAKEVRFNAPTSVGGYSEYKTASLQSIAAGFRVPYELVSGDLSEVNFSSMRGGLIEFRRLVSTIQWQILIQLCLQPIWEWWCEVAYLADVIDSPFIPVEWSPPEFAWVNPQEDVKTAQMEVRSGFRSWQSVVAEKGRNPDDVLDEIDAFNTAVDDRGIVLDTDPRKTTAQGLQQKSPESDAGEEPELSRPNRKANDTEDGQPAALRSRRAGSGRELRPGSQHDRAGVDHWRERSPLRLVGRNGIRRAP